jgi:alanyl-tRNA synthetase
MLYHKPFLSEHTSRIISVKDDLVEVNETIFYPGGGGQPCDLGRINDTEVIEVFKEEGKIIHKLKSPAAFNVGDEVFLKIDKDRRLRLIKMHTGEHILFKSLEKIFGDIELVKIDLDENKSSLFIKTKMLDWPGLFKAEELVNRIINEDRDIIEHEYTKEEAIAKGVRIKAERIASDIVRVVEVKDFDLSACAGIHVLKTKQIGNLLITKFNITKGNWEIRFKTDVSDLSYYTKIVREASTLLETDDIIGSAKRMQKESEDYKERFRRISLRLLDHNNAIDINGKRFIYNVVEDVEKKQLTDKSVELCKESIVCFISIGEKNTVLLNIDAKFNINAPELLNKALAKFGGKGGGRDGFAMGSFSGNPEEFIEEIKKII